MSSASANTNTSFAVLGGNGALSPFVINSLSKDAGVKKLIILSRTSSKSSSLPANAELVSVDYDNHTALVDIYKRYSTDVVISTLSPSASGLAAQKKSAAAAKEAGVKLFVPSE
jgi:glutamyl-tRNA reductase